MLHTLSTILAVDDDPLVLQRIERLLSKAGLEVKCASGGEEALRLAKSGTFALAIVDYHMARMNGRAVLEELRKIQPQCARLLLSGGLDLSLVMEVVNACQIHRVLEKPFTRQRLLAAVNELLTQADQRTTMPMQDKAPTLLVLNPGTVVGDYAIENCLGQGGMSTVYGAVHRVIGRRAALKVMNLAAAPDSLALTRFIDEAKVVNRLGGESNVEIFSYGMLPDGRAYLVMEWLDGETLRHRMDRGKLPLPHVVRIVDQLCGALAAIHVAGFVHRDIKPENIMLLKGDDLRLKLLDFGLAKIIGPDAPKHTIPGMLMGTPHYLSPEQASGNDAVSPASDVYALGVVLYELLTGRYPLGGSNLQQIVFAHLIHTPDPPSKHASEIPESVDRLVMAMLSKAPHERPSSSEVRSTLARYEGSFVGFDAADTMVVRVRDPE